MEPNPPSLTDRLVFLISVLVLGGVNVFLLASGRIEATWNGFGVILAAGLTLALYSFLYRDNPLFKIAENLYVGVAAAYTFIQIWYTVIPGRLSAKGRPFLS